MIDGDDGDYESRNSTSTIVGTPSGGINSQHILQLQYLLGVIVADGDQLTKSIVEAAKGNWFQNCLISFKATHTNKVGCES